MLRYATTSVLAIILISSTAIEAARSGKQHEHDAFLYAVWDSFPYSVGDEFPALLVTIDESDQSDHPAPSEAQSSLRPTVIGHGILAGKYLAEYRDSLK